MRCRGQGEQPSGAHLETQCHADFARPEPWRHLNVTVLFPATVLVLAHIVGDAASHDDEGARTRNSATHDAGQPEVVSFPSCLRAVCVVFFLARHIGGSAPSRLRSEADCEDHAPDQDASLVTVPTAGSAMSSLIELT